MRAREIMAQPVVVVTEGASLEEAAWLMLDRRVGCLPVVDERGSLAGILCGSDFVTKVPGASSPGTRAPGLPGHWVGRGGAVLPQPPGSGLTVREVMTAPVHAVQEDDSVAAVVRLMLGQALRRVPVLRGRVPVGVVARHDILRVVLLDMVAREASQEPWVRRAGPQPIPRTEARRPA